MRLYKELRECAPVAMASFIFFVVFFLTLCHVEAYSTLVRVGRAVPLSPIMQLQELHGGYRARPNYEEYFGRTFHRSRRFIYTPHLSDIIELNQPYEDEE